MWHFYNQHDCLLWIGNIVNEWMKALYYIYKKVRQRAAIGLKQSLPLFTFLNHSYSYIKTFENSTNLKKNQHKIKQRNTICESKNSNSSYIVHTVLSCWLMFFGIPHGPEMACIAKQSIIFAYTRSRTADVAYQCPTVQFIWSSFTATYVLWLLMHAIN